MKYLTSIFSICLLALFMLLSCSRKEALTEYTGTITEIRETTNSNTPEQEPVIQEFSTEVAFLLENGKLKRRNAEGTVFCEGDYTLTNNKFEFSTDDCGCWCECNPNVDCGGDILMGEYEVEIVEGNLVLFSENTWDFGGSQFVTKTTKTGTLVPQ